MNRVISVFLAFSFLFFIQIVNAQEDYDFYLQKARQRLAEGDCTRAEASYNTYKDMAHKTDKEIELLIEECKSEEVIEAGSDLTFTVNGVSFTLKLVEGGTFQMGGNDYDNAKPIHSVTVSSFYMGESEVTQALWEAVMGTTVIQQKDKEDPSKSLNGVGNDYPMYYVNWEDCQLFIQELNRIVGMNFRLPTEAEWEYAARGGSKGNGCWFSGSFSLPKVAWYKDNSGGSPHPVMTKMSNELGLYDMSGNVWEWCGDWYESDYYSNSPSINPQGPRSGLTHVLRGGSYFGNELSCRVSIRFTAASKYPNIRNSISGFRLCLPQ